MLIVVFCYFSKIDFSLLLYATFQIFNLFILDFNYGYLSLIATLFLSDSNISYGYFNHEGCRSINYGNFQNFKIFPPKCMSKHA